MRSLVMADYPYGQVLDEISGGSVSRNTSAIPPIMTYVRKLPQPCLAPHDGSIGSQRCRRNGSRLRLAVSDGGPDVGRPTIYGSRF